VKQELEALSTRVDTEITGLRDLRALSQESIGSLEEIKGELRRLIIEHELVVNELARAKDDLVRKDREATEMKERILRLEQQLADRA